MAPSEQAYNGQDSSLPIGGSNNLKRVKEKKSQTRIQNKLIKEDSESNRPSVNVTKVVPIRDPQFVSREDPEESKGAAIRYRKKGSVTVEPKHPRQIAKIPLMI